uniref:Membrane-associated kinase regulator 4 n=1 Tax=Leersia perrieri TaxID=77586 RepID=A0A0D9WHD7_9ORYZ
MASKQQGKEALLHEEGYIDMDLTSAAASSAPGEFEFNFPMSGPLGRGWDQPDSLASPADELFYKGKLLPLHMPPRAQMVEDLLDAGGNGIRRRPLPLAISTAPATPYESCAASPANSCYGGASGELNVEEYFQLEYAARLADAAAAAAAACEKKPWSRKLRFMRQLNLGLKLKASKAYIKTIFAAGAKPGIIPSSGDDAVHGATARGGGRGAKELVHGGNGHRAWRRNPFGHIRSSNRSIAASPGAGAGAGENGRHRRSFSSVIVRYSASNYKTSPSPPPSWCSSSSTSSSERSSSESSDGGAAALRRSSSGGSSEAENPIQGLIAYCKKSQQLASVRKSASDAGFRFLSSAASSKIAAAESDGMEELVEICRG